MSASSPKRQGFRRWIDNQVDPPWPLLPLTHVTKGIGAEDIVDDMAIKPGPDAAGPRAYFFYGRPAYRVAGENVVKFEAACPFCFILDSVLLNDANEIFAFDTGAFKNRMYKHVLLDEMSVGDFSLEKDASRPNRLISRVFQSLNAYFDGNISMLPVPDEGAEPWEFHARAYLQLLTSPGRNEPDDRICSIEVTFGTEVPLLAHLKAIVVPHTLWDDDKKAPWLVTLASNHVEIRPYLFVPGRHPEHYHTMLERTVRDLYEEWGLL